MARKYILTQLVAEKKMRRMAYEILENNTDEPQLLLAGIRESGTVLAKNIQRLLREIGYANTELVTLSLDKREPKEVHISRQVSLDGRVIIVIDDVSNSGKTLLYAMKPFLDHHPKKIQTLVLVERRHNAFPVKPDYVGISLSTTLQEHIYVELEGDEVKATWLE